LIIEKCLASDVKSLVQPTFSILIICLFRSGFLHPWFIYLSSPPPFLAWKTWSDLLHNLPHLIGMKAGKWDLILEAEYVIQKCDSYYTFSQLLILHVTHHFARGGTKMHEKVFTHCQRKKKGLGIRRIGK